VNISPDTFLIYFFFSFAQNLKPDRPTEKHGLKPSKNLFNRSTSFQSEWTMASVEPENDNEEETLRPNGFSIFNERFFTKGLFCSFFFLLKQPLYYGTTFHVLKLFC
jgi:hypothetical protein